jgi:hypothetical protein
VAGLRKNKFEEVDGFSLGIGISTRILAEKKPIDFLVVGSCPFFNHFSAPNKDADN